MHADGSGTPTIYTYFALFITIIFFGSNFVPVTGVNIRNYAFFQWVMCNAVLLSALPWCLFRHRVVELHPIAVLGGISWCCGNFLCPLIIDRLGLGVGSLLWGTVEMVTAWMSGTFGILGVERQVVRLPWLNFLGVLIVISGGIVLAQVSSDSSGSSASLTSSFSSLSSSLCDSVHSSLMEYPSEGHASNVSREMKDDEQLELEMPELVTSPERFNPILLSTGLLEQRSDQHMRFSSTNEAVHPDRGHPPTKQVGYHGSHHHLSPTTLEDSQHLSLQADIDWAVSEGMNPTGKALCGEETALVPQSSLSPTLPFPHHTTMIIPPSTHNPLIPTTNHHPGTSEHSYISPHAADSRSEAGSVSDGVSRLGLRPFDEGVILALLAGVMFGVSFNPTQYLVDQTDGELTAGTLIVSHYVGICYTSYLLFFCSIAMKLFMSGNSSSNSRVVSTTTMDPPICSDDVPLQGSDVILDMECIIPALLAGILWGFGAIAWFIAAESLPISVTFPLISAGPNIVTMGWSLLYFQEVKRRKDQAMLGVALVLLGSGLFCVWFSNV